MNAPRTRAQRRPVHGVLLLDKPLGCSSNQALQKVKWLFQAEKAGHTGTLDPLASGVLPICLGAATKFSQIHLDADKSYETTIALGVTTNTGDLEGVVQQTRPVTCTSGQVIEVLDRFMGEIEQIPPMHSALKHEGKALYQYAREGQTIERKARMVRVHALELLELSLQNPRPSLTLRVQCSKGTYIRTLGEDIGAALGCGGHLVALRRIRTGPFDLHGTVTMAQLEAMSDDERMHSLLPVSALLPEHAPLFLGPEDATRFLTGLRRRGSWPDALRIAVWAEQTQHFLGTAHIRSGELIPDRLLTPIEIQSIDESTSS